MIGQSLGLRRKMSLLTPQGSTLSEILRQIQNYERNIKTLSIKWEIKVVNVEDKETNQPKPVEVLVPNVAVEYH